MIISHPHRFVFLHIPKCAGTSVRQQLQPFDTSDGRFSGPLDHEKLGAIYGTHLPLSILEKHFPETFEEVRAFRAFAVMRDPEGRFRSALAQRLRELHSVELAHAEDDLVEDEIGKVIEELSKGEELPPKGFIHFLPQHRWIEHEDERFADDLFWMSDVAGMLSAISNHTGERLGEALRANESAEYRFPGLIRTTRRASTALRERLPVGAYRSIVKMAKPLLTKDKGGTPKPLPGGETLSGFLRDYYARDFELAGEVTSREAAS
ncbi:hypothetical protein HK107_01940 [Parvularcula sp. ZS-1/3]|uniref:Sulfotransferase family protein n=1 Tax=Parvularcula mediterranea TaxID=2732508 RepID=A0A7Y3W427_9PROT|nr:hypothetical protein [Parvularcula mediterranea]NNU15084.1 hypothetical protein [Parvularcula mediterranea]